MTHTLRTRSALGLLVAAAMLALTACGGGDGGDGGDDNAGSSEEPTSQESAADAPEGQEPDLEGIPDVVAEVNGEEVTKDEFVVLYVATYKQAVVQAQSGGEQPDEDALKEQTVDNLVNTELLAQEADARGISVTEEDVDAELTALAEQSQLASVEELLAALDEQGVTEDQARAQVESQALIEQLVIDEAGPVEPTEQDLRKIYNRVKKQQAQAGDQAQAIPPYAEVEAQLEEQAKSDRMNEVAQSLVEDLRKDADITINP